MVTRSEAPSGASSLETLTILGRLRGTRHLWAFAVLVALAATMFVAEAMVVRRELSTGDLGFDVRHSPDLDALVASLEPGRWPELRPGDNIRSLNGARIGIQSFFVLRTQLPQGPLVVEYERDGVIAQTRGVVAPPTIVALMSFAIRWLTGGLVFLLGIGAFILRPGTRVSWVFFLFTLHIGALLVLTVGFPLGTLSGYVLLTTLFSLAPVLGLHFFALFPMEERWLLRALRPLYAALCVLWLVRVVPALFFEVAPGTLARFDVVGRIMAVIVALVLLGHLVRRWQLARRQHDARALSMARTLAIGALLGLVAPMVINALVRALAWDGGVAHQLSPMLVLSFVALTTLVLARHNPLEIDRYSVSVVGYVLTLGAFGVLFALTLLTLPFLLKRYGLGDRAEVLVGLTAATVFSIGPAYRKLRKQVDRWFSREQADALQTSAVLQRIADAVQRQTRDGALKTILEGAALIGPEFAGVWQVDPSGGTFHRVAALGDGPEATPLPRTSAFSASVERSGGVSALAPVSYPPEAQQTLWRLGLVMVVPVRAHGVAVGFLGVGRRRSGFGYRTEDLAFLETLGAQAGLAMERSDVVTQIGRYRIERRLAAGGMAEVFVAWQLGLGGFERKVALKRLLPELAEDPRSAAGLLDEARITARLQHRNIAQVFEVGVDAGQHFIAMELVDGPPLRSLLAAQKRANQHTPLQVALAIGRGLLLALEHAHELTDGAGNLLHVVHRDVTPSNVLVSKTGEPKLVDFGLVMANTRLFRTETGIARGTLPFMSPEQTLHTAVDRRADVYAAGATLYEVFTGGRAFLDGAFGPKPERPSVLRPDLPATLDAVLLRAVKAEAAERFATAGAFLSALLAACPSVTAAAEPEVAEWVRRYADDLPTAPSEPREADATQSQAVPTAPIGPPST